VKSAVSRTCIEHSHQVLFFGFKFGQFEDDRHCSKLRTTLAKYAPAHILIEKNGISKETKQILDSQGTLLESLGKEEMMDASQLLRILSESDYFKTNGHFKWPDAFKVMLSESRMLALN
jgi:DNA mismatch repair protein MSH6